VLGAGVTRVFGLVDGVYRHNKKKIARYKKSFMKLIDINTVAA